MCAGRTTSVGGRSATVSAVDEEGESFPASGLRRSRRGRVEAEVQVGFPSLQRESIGTQYNASQYSQSRLAGPSFFERHEQEVQTDTVTRASVGTPCDRLGAWDLDLRGRRVTRRPSAGSYLPTGLLWSEASGWERVLGVWQRGTEREVLDSSAYVGRVWKQLGLRSQLDGRLPFSTVSDAVRSSRFPIVATLHFRQSILLALPFMCLSLVTSFVSCRPGDGNWDVDAASGAPGRHCSGCNTLIRRDAQQRETARGHNFADETGGARELPTEDGAHWVHPAGGTRDSARLSRVTGHYFGVYTCVSSVEHEARTDVRVLGMNLFVTLFQDPPPLEDDPH